MNCFEIEVGKSCFAIGVIHNSWVDIEVNTCYKVIEVTNENYQEIEVTQMKPYNAQPYNTHQYMIQPYNTQPYNTCDNTLQHPKFHFTTKTVHLQHRTDSNMPVQCADTSRYRMLLHSLASFVHLTTFKLYAAKLLYQVLIHNLVYKILRLIKKKSRTPRAPTTSSWRPRRQPLPP